jgi:hypothetical protein
MEKEPSAALKYSSFTVPVMEKEQSFDNQKLKKKNTADNFLYLFLIKYCNLLMSKLQEKPSALKREHPALQKMNFVNFFLCLWVIFALLNSDPHTDPGTPLNLDPIRILIGIRINSTAYTVALP